MKGLKIVLSVIALSLLCATVGEAQSKSKKKPASAAAKKKARDDAKKKDEESFWTTKMWYGLELNYPSLGGRLFQISLSPMAGYKINETFSAGLILKPGYTWFRFENTVLEDSKYEYIDFGAGLFARARIYRGLYAHVDFDRSRFDSTIDFNNGASYDVDVNNKLIKSSVVKNNAYVGLGWSSGFGKVQSQISVYRNITDSNERFRGTWDFRLGFTYNF